MDNQSSQQGQSTLSIPTEVRSYLESLLTDAGMTVTEDQLREEMIKELFVRLDSYITSVIVDNLPPENLDEFVKMSEEKKSMTEIEQYLKDKIPNSQEMFTNAFIDFRNLYLGKTTVARTAPQDTKTSDSQAQSRE